MRLHNSLYITKPFGKTKCTAHPPNAYPPSVRSLHSSCRCCFCHRDDITAQKHVNSRWPSNQWQKLQSAIKSLHNASIDWNWDKSGTNKNNTSNHSDGAKNVQTDGFHVMWSDYLKWSTQAQASTGGNSSNKTKQNKTNIHTHTPNIYTQNKPQMVKNTPPTHTLL